MASTDARPLPLKNTAYRFTFAIRKPSDGTLITSWTGADSEVSKDGGSFSDCTNEATEIGTSGVGYIDLTSTEMNADTVALKVTVTNTGAVPQVYTFLPEESSDRDPLIDGIWDEGLTGASHNVPTSAGVRLRNVSGGIVTQGTAQGGTVNSITLASGASSTDGTYDPAGVRLVGGTGAGQIRLILHYVGSTRVATVDRDWRTAPDNTTDYEIIAAPNLMSTNEGLAQAGSSSTITLNTSASAVDDTYKGQLCVIRTGTGQDQSRLIASYVGATKVATVASPWVTTPNSGSAYMMLPTGRALVVAAEAGSITGASFATDAITATALAASAVTEIQSGLATAANLATLTGYVDTEVAAIKAKTDALPASPAAVGDIPSAATIADAVWDEAIAGHAAAGSTGEALSDAASGAGGGGASAADIADAVWDEALAGHATAGTGGKVLTDAATAAALATVAGYVDTEVAAIKAKTDALPSDPADESSIQATLATLATAANLATLTSYVDTEVAAIKAKTDALPSDPADESSIQATLATLATSANLATLTGYVDTEVAAIKAKTDLLPADPADASDIPSAISIADALLDRADGIETDLTPRQAMRLFAAALAGKLSGAGTTTITIRNVGDTKDRITALVTTDGDRTAVTTDLS